MNKGKDLLHVAVAFTWLCCAVVWAQQPREPSSAGDAAKPYSVTAIGQPQKVETLVGRGDKIEVIGKNGKITEFNRGELPPLNRYKTGEPSVAVPTKAKETEKTTSEAPDSSKEAPGSAQPQEPNKEGETAAAPNNQGDTAAESKKQGEPQPPGKREKPTQGTKDAKVDAKATKAKAEAEKAAKERAEEIRKANTDQLRKLEWEQAWFYDKKGRPLSREEVDKRIEKGDIADIRTTDIYLQHWKPEPEKPAEENKAESASSGANMQEK